MDFFRSLYYHKDRIPHRMKCHPASFPFPSADNKKCGGSHGIGYSNTRYDVSVSISLLALPANRKKNGGYRLMLIWRMETSVR